MLGVHNIWSLGHLWFKKLITKTSFSLLSTSALISGITQQELCMCHNGIVKYAQC